jgi:DNA-binding NtrC family response regulator
VSATNQNPWLSGSTALRPDLLYRLAGFTLLLPPLRARNGDVELLARAFTESFAVRHGDPEVHLDDSAVAMLRQYTWPGNVRELRAVVEHACVICRDATIRSEHVRAALDVHGQGPAATEQSTSSRTPPPHQGAGQTMGLRDVERELISRALDQHGGNVSRAARALQIPRSTLREKIKRYGLR